MKPNPIEDSAEITPEPLEVPTEQAVKDSLARDLYGRGRIAYLAFMLPGLGTFALAAYLHPRPGLDSLLLPLVLVYVAALASMAVYLRVSMKKRLSFEMYLRDLSLRDDLTPVRNRRYLREYMDARTGAFFAGTGDAGSVSQRTLGVIVATLGNPRRLGDLHGAEAGEAVLRSFATLLERSVRPADVVARWEGDKFVVLAPDADRQALEQVAGRILRRVETRLFPLPSGQTVRVGCSVGYSAFPVAVEGPSLGWEELVGIADRALLHAKAMGGSRAVGAFLAPGVRKTPEKVMRALRTMTLDLAEASGFLDLVLSADAKTAPGPLRLVADCPA